MKDKGKTKGQLIKELAEVRQKIAGQKVSRVKDMEDALRVLHDNSTMGIYIVQDGKFRFTNSMFQQLVGYSEEELLDMDSLSLVWLEDRYMVRKNAVKMLKRESSSPYQFRYITKGGECLWGMQTVTSIRYQERQAALGYIIDITECKQNDEKYRHLSEDIKDGYAIVQNGKYVFTNRRLGDIFGCEPEQIIGKSFDQFAMPNDRQAAMEQYERVMSGEEAPATQYEGEMTRVDGTKISLESSVKPIQYDNKSVFNIIVRDFTERKQAEEKIRQAAGEWEIIFDSISDLISIHDRNFRIVRVNNAAASVLNRKPQELVGKKCYEVFHGTTEPVPDCPHIQMLKTKETASGEFFEPHLGIYLEVSTSPILSNEGNMVGSVHITRNITERKRAEGILKELYERERELREGLEAERRRRIEFTRVLVHELKTPLTPMLASSQLLLEELHGEETLLRLAKNISQGTLNLSNRVDELLDLMQGETGMLRLEIESVDLLPLLQKAADAIAPMASSNGHSLILDLPPFLPSVRADQDRLQQIILNLLNNASKSTPKGGEITLRARENDDALVVEVQDTGHGIAKEEYERIFDPYHRVENDRQRFSGMGLGLALCKKLIELHGGQIWVKSRPNEGSTFGFSLPLEDH